MMKQIFTIFLGLLCATPAAAQDVLPDGPWVALPAGYEVQAAPTLADIRAMADLDGNPAVTTQEETRMIALLMQVLIGTPITE